MISNWSRLAPIVFATVIAIGSGGVFCTAAQAERIPQSGLEVPTTTEGLRRAIRPVDLVTLRESGGVHGTGLSISPDGNYFSFELHQADLATNSYRVGWFVAGIATGGIPANVGDGGDPTLFRSSAPNGRINGAWVSDYAKWSPDSRGIAYRRRIDGETQVWWSSRDGSEREQLTHSAADVEAFHWSNNGKRIFFTTDADREELREENKTRYRNGHVFDLQKDWSTIGGRPFYPPYLLTDGRPRVWVLDVELRVERLASDDELLEYEQLVNPQHQKVSPLGARHITRTVEQSGIAWLVPATAEKQGRSPPMTLYASRSFDGSDPVRCQAAECTGSFDLSRPLLRGGLHWSDVDEEILFVLKDGTGYSKRTLYGWRIGQRHVRKILTTDDWISDCSVVRDRAICFRETPTHPRTVISIDLATGSTNTLVDLNPEFRNLLIGHVELFEWKNARGHATFGYLVKPHDYVSDRRYPLVIVGYRARLALRGGVGEEYPVHVLAANGFIVLVYEKLSPYEALELHADPIDISKARWGPDLFDFRMPLSSFESAVRILTEKGLVDPSRVGITGLSNGVNHVNYSLIHSDLFAAAITSSSDFGPSNYYLVGASSEFFRKHRRAIGLGRHGDPDGFLWQHVSLALNAERVNAPLLVNAADTEHPWALEEIVTLIEKRKPVEMVVYPDEYHIKWQPAHRLAIYERNVDWFNFWLQDVVDPAPSKAPQYYRWHQLQELYTAASSGDEDPA